MRALWVLVLEFLVGIQGLKMSREGFPGYSGEGEHMDPGVFGGIFEIRVDVYVTPQASHEYHLIRPSIREDVEIAFRKVEDAVNRKMRQAGGRGAVSFAPAFRNWAPSLERKCPASLGDVSVLLAKTYASEEKNASLILLTSCRLEPLLDFRAVPRSITQQISGVPETMTLLQLELESDRFLFSLGFAILRAASVKNKSPLRVLQAYTEERGVQYIVEVSDATIKEVAAWG